MERHFHYEEHELFPKLEGRGLAAEVQVAVKHFEGDYIYPELTHADWRELMKETVAQKQTVNP
jgi:hypothetical protein